MNLVSVAPVWLLVPLIVLLLAAAIEDAIRLRISNWTSIGVLLLAIVAVFATGFSTALWQNLAVFVGLLVAGTLAFASGKIGGGDVKLLAALGAWMNFQGGLWLPITVFLAGGLLALGFIVARLFKRRSSKAGIPYGLAIVTGALVTFAFQRGIF